MSLGNLKKLQGAERLLKQGKTAEALEQLERLAKAAPSDVLTINRMGDLLARQGRTAEAIGYYFKIAAFYTDGGYLPKAIAIYKKIVRLDPKSSISLSRLGELYLKQKLPAEAQRFLTTAAQQYEEAGDFAGAREAYEKLVKTDPDSPLHRAKLADAMAAGGDTESALAELLHLGDTLQRSGKGRDAEKVYRRALKLDPGSPETILGVSRALNLQGNLDEAIACLEASLADGCEPQILSETVLLYERAARPADTERLLRSPGAQVVPESVFIDLLELAISRDDVGGLWERLDRVTADWYQQGHGEKVGDILERLGQVEEGHIPALERFENHLTAQGHTSGAARILERLVKACRREGDYVRADEALSRLAAVAPMSSLLNVPSASAPVAAAPGLVPAEFEAPAVPLSRPDKEFVTGRLTQAEILEKYSLIDQAQAQILEVTARFPGHVAAQQKLLSLRRAGDPAAVRDTLVSLALACRAAGDSATAADSAREALQIGGLDSRTHDALRSLGLLGGAPTPPPAIQAPPEPPALRVTPQPASRPAPTASPQAAAKESQDGFLIDFDAEDALEIEPTAHVPAPGPAPSAALPVDEGPSVSGPVRAPGQDMLAEIRQYLAQGRAEEAQRGIIALESLGYGCEELDQLAARAEGMLVTPDSPGARAPEADDGEATLTLDLDADSGAADASAFDLSDADDLSTITAALEGEAGDNDGPLTPDAGTEQSVEEVFAAFRQAVEDEVGEDSRTHYDLAIGYKEMGLLEEAIAGFEIAARSRDLAREAHMMLGVCHRESGQISKSVEHYRRAAALECDDPEIRMATHYDLAEVLIQDGDEPAALDELRRVLKMDPRYRDVQQRVGDLETRLQT